MKWIYGLLTVCLLFLVACDNETSKNKEHNDNEKSSETTTTEKDTTTKSTKEDTKTKKEQSNNNSENNPNNNHKKQSTDKIPVEENVNGVKPNNYNETETIDTEAYTIARNCLLNQGNSQAECDKAENTIEFTRAWQNLTRDGYLCNDEGCTLPNDNNQNNQGHDDQQHSNTNEDSKQGSNEQSNETYQDNNKQAEPSSNMNQHDKNANSEGRSQSQESEINEFKQSDQQERQFDKAS